MEYELSYDGKGQTVRPEEGATSMQAFNPYLPSWEYIPDGEPRVFGDRVYVYGSHDHFNAPIF